MDKTCGNCAKIYKDENKYRCSALNFDVLDNAFKETTKSTDASDCEYWEEMECHMPIQKQ